GYALGAANIIFAIDFLTKEELGEMEKKYNITLSEKRQIMAAIRNGKILLDVPFKSVDEVINLHGPNENLLMYKERMAKYNLLSPIDTLGKLKDLNLTFLVFFDTANTVFSTREDSNFAKKLLDANAKGTNIVIMTDNGGHFADHKTLWKMYSSLTQDP
ncbi:MAG TPA: hypothetical protein VN457_05590, partial [Chlamydiales bacterium]|nr:hypothetical protein [Chlamydiales bacterium]